MQDRADRDRIEVRDGTDHVEVIGLSAEDVQSAIELYRAVDDSKLHARSALEDHLNRPSEYANAGWSRTR